MNRTPRWTIGIVALLLATFACTNQADAQSTYLPPYQSFDGYQSFNNEVVTSPQSYPSTTYSPHTYSPSSSNLYGSQSQTQNSYWTPQLPPANSYSAPQPTVHQNALFPQKTIAKPFTFHSNTVQTPVCQGGS